MKPAALLVVLASLASIPGGSAGTVEERLAEPVLHLGACDGSAGSALTDDLFVAGNDEDNTLRVYRARSGGVPIFSLDLTRFLEFERVGPDGDVEGAARIGDRIYWIGSHARTAQGRPAPNTRLLFAVEVRSDSNQPRLEPVGKPYKRLLADLESHPALLKFNLARAASLAPKDKGALNIEGLGATKEGHLLIGFRNPVPDGRALVVPLLNPDAVVAKGEQAQLGDPMLLDLGGLGIRDLTAVHGRYLIVAGSYEGGGKARLFVWDGGKSQPEAIKKLPLKDYNPEAILTYPGAQAGEFQLLSDDGNQEVGGKNCEDLTDPSRKQFRSIRVFIPE